MIKELEFLSEYIYEIIHLDEEIRAALSDARMDDYHRLSTRLCCRAAFVAGLMKSMMS